MKATYTVDLNFDIPMDDEQKDAIVQKIAQSLYHTVNTAGLVPDDSEAITEMITVTRDATGKTSAIIIGK